MVDYSGSHPTNFWNNKVSFNKKKNSQINYKYIANRSH